MLIAEESGLLFLLLFAAGSGFLVTLFLVTLFLVTLLLVTLFLVTLFLVTLLLAFGSHFAVLFAVFLVTLLLAAFFLLLAAGGVHLCVGSHAHGHGEGQGHHQFFHVSSCFLVVNDG